MAVKYKQKCSVCKKNYVVTTYRTRYVVCYECQKKEMDKEIKDERFKKLFDIPEEYYKENSFLRDIKIKYIRYQSLTDNQIKAFKETVEKIRQSRS